MQANKQKLVLRKIDFAKDGLNIAKTLIEWKDVVPSMVNFFANKKEAMETFSLVFDIAKGTSGKALVKLAEKKLEAEQEKNKFENGLYVVENSETGEYAGLFGLKVEEVKNGKIQAVSLDSFWKGGVSKETQLLQKTGAVDIANKYFSNVLFPNIKEYHPDATAFVKYLESNKPVRGYMNRLGLTTDPSVKTTKEPNGIFSPSFAE